MCSLHINKVLITGGAGYIATHTLIELNSANFDFVVVDNFANSNIESLKRVEQIIDKKIVFIQADLRDKNALREVFASYKIDAVVHFAGLKAVGESVEKPLIYYDNNVCGTVVLLEIMQEFGCKKIIFSSSATVYGNPKICPIDENAPVGETTNPYGSSKYMIERIILDLISADREFQAVILRYFNPVGAHESGLIGEDPNGIPNNLMPFINQVAVGKREFLSVFGSDYPTIDGTGVRDYIHVMDLANAHVKALQYINSTNYNHKETIFNIGTGRGYSVLEMVRAYEKASGQTIAHKITEKRAGDTAVCFANPQKAQQLLGWKATRSLEDMCKSSWNWQSKNPDGYR